MFASLLVVALIGAIAWAGSAIGLSYLFGVVLPYVAVVTFFLGVIWRMVYWAKSPVPFSIPTTGGQEKSLDFIKHEKWDCPNTIITPHMSGNMALGLTCDLNVDMFCADLARYAAGELPLHLVDRVRGY